MAEFKKLFFEDGEGLSTQRARTVSFFAVILMLSLLTYYVFSETKYNFNWEPVWGYRDKFITGFFNTILISVAALFLSVAFGVFFAFGQKSRFLPLKFFSRIYIELIRGTPLLVQVLIFFYVFADAFGFDNRFVAGIFIMAFFGGAYSSEIIRAGIDSVPKDQYEASKALNFTTFKMYQKIILPQAVKVMLPPMAGQFANLIKDSSLLSIISINEFTMNAQEVNAYTYSTLESYIPLAIGYLLLTYPLSYLSSLLEKRMQKKT